MRWATAGRRMAGALAATGALVGNPLPAVSPGKAEARPAPRSTLRVGLWTLWHDREVVLAASAPGHQTMLSTCAECAFATLDQSADIHADGDALLLSAAGKSERAGEIRLTGTITLAAHGEKVTLQNPTTIAARHGMLVIAVTLPVESYVERVVASESGPADSAESLKALAVVVRTFALHENHGHAEYDLCDSTHCQLLHWGGRSERQAVAHAAALATAGETLWFKGRRALGYFHQDCGGRTATPAEIWQHAGPATYLPSHVDAYCTRSGGRTWATEMTRAELTSALAAHGLVRPGWQSLTVARRGESGRAVVLRLDATEVSAEDFRLAVGESLGWNRLPSTWFEVSSEGDRFVFHGRGSGHGVGLCQAGAAAMAAQGHSAREILAEYFPGTVTADESTGMEWKSLGGTGFVLETLDGADSAYLPEVGRARAEAAQRSGLDASEPFTMRTFGSVQGFRDATLAPGWVAAFTEGDWIGVQPLRILAGRHLLESTLRHEFLHALVELEAGPQTPLWLREGLVEVWSEPEAARRAPNPGPLMTLDAVDAGLANARSEAESEAAHQAAAEYAARLLDRYGRTQVLAWLRSGVPGDVAASLGRR